MKLAKLWNEYNNPFYLWWKAHKWFKFPYIHIHIGKPTWFFGMPIRKDYYNPIFGFLSSGVGWKLKYDMVRHEWPPFIEIRIFRKLQILFVFNYITKSDKDSWVRDTATWEAMLEMIYQNKSIQDAVKDHVWGDNITIHNNLTKWAKSLL